MMKILIVNTSESTGGAAVAANRLSEALRNNGTEATMLVREKFSKRSDVVLVGSRVGNFLRFCYERFVIWLCNRLSRRNLFSVSIANTGIDITKTREFRDADVIHLHWINHGMLSLRGIRKILDSGKPVVWTMHDMWPATAICHYAHECKKYENKCENCPVLPRNSLKIDLSDRIWKQKQKMLSERQITFVACSGWLRNQAQGSRLLKGQFITNIPNAIDMQTFRPHERNEAREKLCLPIKGKIILFVSQRVTDTRKGTVFLIEAIEKMVAQHPEMKDNTAVAILGGHSEELTGQFPLPAYPLGYVSDQQKIVEIYNAADVFVLPSLSDNLPNTVMEAMACGVPCVGFEVGGIPEMIDHLQNGYVAKFRDSDDLANGIRWVLQEADYQAISRESVEKVKRSYSEASVASRYVKIYREAMEQTAKRQKND